MKDLENGGSWVVVVVVEGEMCGRCCEFRM